MSIKARLLLAFLASILVTTLSILAVIVWQMRQDALAEFETSSRGQLTRINDLFEASFKQSEEIAAYVAGLPEAAAALGKLPSYVDLTEPVEYARNDLTPEGLSLDLQFERLQKAFPAFDVVSMGMEDGTYWQYPPTAKKPGYDPRARGWYKQGQEAAGVTAVTPVFQSTTGGLIYSVLAKVSQSGKTIGIVTLDISLDTLVKQVSGIKLGQTGYIMLLQDDGAILADPGHKDLEFKNINEGGIPALKDVAALEDQTLRVDIDGTDRFVTAFTGYRGWRLLAVIDASEVYAETNTVIMHIVFIACGIAVLLLLAAIKFAGSISKPLLTIVDTAQRIAGGDLKALPETTSLSGEMKDLHTSLYQMVNKLMEFIGTAEAKSREAAEQAAHTQAALKDAELSREEAERNQNEILAAASHLESVAEVLSGASRELTAQIKHAEQGALEQATRVADAAAAMDKMSATMHDVTRSAEAASEASLGTRQKAETGSEVVEKAVDSIRQVQEESLKLKQDMETLGEHAQSISQIMGVISDIADQTNLLALNAAIEAARAGEAGRGFAVVADEVRKLAEKTMASTTDVANAIKAIQQSAGASMNQVDLAVAAIEQATRFAHESGAALTEIVDMVDATAAQARAIAEANEEQASAGDGINLSIGQMNTIAGETASNMQQAAHTVAELAAQAGELTALIAKMKR